MDDRRDLQGELGEFARTSGMRISGPNCLGLANVKHDIWATSLPPAGQSGLTGPIGLVCQSGATAFGPFLVRAVENGIGFSYIISTGNEADLDFTDFARYSAGRSGHAGHCRVSSKASKRADKFLAVAKLAAERGKPIVLIKIGRSELGARAAQLAYRGADRRGCPLRCDLCPIRGDPGPGLRRTAGGQHSFWPMHPQARRARHRGGIPLGRGQLAHRRHVRPGRS